MVHSTYTGALQVSLRAAIAAGLAIGIGQLLRLQFPIYAMISAVIVTDLDPAQTRKLGLARLAGSVLGAILGAIICVLLRAGAWEVGLGILLAMFLSHLLGLPGGAKVAGYVCGIVLLSHGDAPWSYALYRTIETMIGIALAILISLVPKLLRDR
ncbi:MAG: FUSC family protein [Bryobacteraceae bacterium]